MAIDVTDGGLLVEGTLPVVRPVVVPAVAFVAVLLVLRALRTLPAEVALTVR